MRDVIVRLRALSRTDAVKAFLVLAPILVVALLTYLPIFGVPLLSDDWHLAWIAAHPTQPWYAYFWTNYAGTASGYAYRPIQILYFIASHELGGTSSLPYHAIQFGFHLANVTLVFVLARIIAGRGKLFLPGVAALLFAVFPNHAEAVAWPSAIGDPTATFFTLGSLVAWIAGREGGARRWLVVSWISAALALASKDMAISLPLVVLAWELSRLGRGMKSRAVIRSALLTLPFFGILAAYLLVRLHASGYLFGYYGAPKVAFDPMVAVRTYLAIPISHFVTGLPRTALMDRLYAIVDTRIEAAAIAVAVIVAIAVARARRDFWWLAAAFALSIAPVMTLGLNHLPWRVSDEGERYAYLPSVFMALLIAFVLDAMRRKARVVGAVSATLVIAVLVVAMSAQLSAKMADWQEAGRLASKTLDSWHRAYSGVGGGQAFAVGLPDNYRGVPVWRNGLGEAEELLYGTRPEAVVTALRTVVDSPHGFMVRDEGGGEFSYVSYMNDSHPADIVGPLAVEETGYYASLGKRTFSIYALTYRDFSDTATFSLEPYLSEHVGSAATALFWDGEGWTARAVRSSPDVP